MYYQIKTNTNMLLTQRKFSQIKKQAENTQALNYYTGYNAEKVIFEKLVAGKYENVFFYDNEILIIGTKGQEKFIENKFSKEVE